MEIGSQGLVLGIMNNKEWSIEELREAILNGDIVINFGERVIDAKAIEEYLQEMEKYSLESKSGSSFEFVIEG